MRCIRVTVIILAVALAAGAAADVWTEPQPFRREALIEGRDYLYTYEAFLHRFSYRHLSDEPPSDQDGARGTGGSVTGDELYLDVHLQKTFAFADGRHGVIVRMQRFEDFDGRYDRQLVGIARRLSDDWSVALVADVRGDKGETDIQLEARWQPDDTRLLRATYVAPELFFNDKSGADGRYRREPRTLFFQYRHAPEDSAHGELAVNWSPEARLDAHTLGLLAKGRQLRLMTRGSLPWREARLGARLELERTDRRFDWSEPPVPGAERFERRMHAIDLYAEFPHRRWAPTVGVRRFRLEETGWFGTALATTGRLRHDEHLVWASVLVRTGARHHLEPALYVSDIDALRTFDQQPQKSRDRSEYAAKLALAWRYSVTAEPGAILTINPTFRLHGPRFGGGNIQLHWPL
jgi:hypothetical protein